ncbi:MAG: efflux RND transporter periplasmic adaptor subunit, partial [Anaerolineales bacterium]
MTYWRLCTVKKTLIWLLVLILIAGSIWAVFYFRNVNSQNDVPEILRSAEIINADLTQTVAASGKFGFAQSVDLYFKTSGTVASIAVVNGENVAQGQLLATLDTP